ncbi:methyltransferase domain-containing protein [Candidatus Bathyarchaeota archaeon]|nr:methyltransferase domain-containing protein [Candidatus Bathyarchaeota archaeon]
MWEEYYSIMRQLPDWLKRPVPFIVDSLSLFKEYDSPVFLDLGCGAGRNLIYLGKEGYDVVGVDVSESALKKTKVRSRTEGLPNLEVLRGSMTRLPFVKQAFDIVISVSVVHHGLKKDIEKALGEIHTVLRDNGLFLANLLSAKDFRYGSGEKLENGTFRVIEDFEQKKFEETHHFFSKEEVLTLLADFEKVNVEPIQSRTKRPHEYWKVIAVK